MKRVAGGRELLDGPLDDGPALAGNLRDLRRVNALLGGVDAEPAGDRNGSRAGGPIRRALRVLDVGTGAADIPLGVRRRWRRAMARA